MWPKAEGQGTYAQVPLGGFGAERASLMALLPAVLMYQLGLYQQQSQLVLGPVPLLTQWLYRAILTPRWRHGLATRML